RKLLTNTSGLLSCCCSNSCWAAPCSPATFTSTSIKASCIAGARLAADWSATGTCMSYKSETITACALRLRHHTNNRPIIRTTGSLCDRRLKRPVLCHAGSAMPTPHATPKTPEERCRQGNKSLECAPFFWPPSDDGMSDKQSLSYKDAGVDIDAGNALVERIKGVAKRTRRPEVMAGLSGFGALFQRPMDYIEPVQASSTVGVGTKLRLAVDLKKHDSFGIDLVAMCVNDLVVAGAEPLFFLYYYATGKLNVDVASDVINGIGIGCEQAGASLVGGETAEMPGMYEGEDYDLAGFCVGIVEK